jgi:hypothetical protein
VVCPPLLGVSRVRMLAMFLRRVFCFCHRRRNQNAPRCRSHHRPQAVLRHRSNGPRCLILHASLAERRASRQMEGKQPCAQQQKAPKGPSPEAH